MEAGTTQLRGKGRETHATERTTASIAKTRGRTTQGGSRKGMLITTIAVILASIGGAGPAGADVLVENHNESRLFLSVSLGTSDIAQGFTTGANPTGYLLESISLITNPGRIVNSETGQREPLYVYLHEDNGGRPNFAQGGQVASLTKNGGNFAGPTEGVNEYRVWKARCYPQPPHGGGCMSDASSVHLEPGSRYWVYVWAGNSDTTIASVSQKTPVPGGDLRQFVAS